MLYGLLQEQMTFVNYMKHATYAQERGRRFVTSIYRLIARDEVAHARFHEAIAALLLAEDRAGRSPISPVVLLASACPRASCALDTERRERAFSAPGSTA